MFSSRGIGLVAPVAEGEQQVIWLRCSGWGKNSGQAGRHWHAISSELDISLRTLEILSHKRF